MSVDCLNCRKTTESKIPKMIRKKKGRILLSTKYAKCFCKNTKYHESSGLLGSLGLKKPSSNTPSYLYWVIFCFFGIK